MTIEERAKQLAENANINPFYKHELRHYLTKIATEQQKIDIEKLKDIMNRLMLDTKDKAEIIKAMEE